MWPDYVGYFGEYLTQVALHVSAFVPQCNYENLFVLNFWEERQNFQEASLLFENG